MDVKKIKITGNDGKIIEIEVNFEVWQFNEEDFWKQDWQNRKAKECDSYEEILRIHMEVYKSGLPKELVTETTEDEYIKKYQIEKLHDAINKLPKKQRERIILRFFYGLTISEIAKIEKCAERNVTLAISAGLDKLRKMSNDFLD